MNKLIVTFDKSQEDIPTLVVAEEGWSYLNPSIVVKNVITGDKAISIWNELKGIDKKGGYNDSRNSQESI